MGVIQLERKVTAPREDGLEHKSMRNQGALAPVETKIIDEDEGIVEAFVAVTGIVDRVNDIIEPGAIGPQLKTVWPVGAVNHDWGNMVAKTLAAEEWLPGDPRLPKTLRDGTPWPAEAGVGWVKAQYNLDTQRGREAFSDVKFFAEDQDWSIGYRATKSRRGQDGIRRIKSMEIPEYSTVLSGAHKQARTLSIKSDGGTMTDAPRVVATFDDHVILSSKGFDGDNEAVVPGSLEAKLDAVETALEAKLSEIDLDGDKAWSLGYHINDKGFIELGEPEAVSIEVVDPPKGDDDEGVESKDGLLATIEFVGQCQDEIKAGRKISGANMAKLKAALGSIADVVALAEAAKEADDEGNKADTSGDVTPHKYSDSGDGSCSVCGGKADAPCHDTAGMKADPGVGGGGPDAMTHEYAKGADGYCSKCGGTEKSAIHDAPFSQPYSGPIDAVGTDTKDDDLNDIEMMMLEQERLCL